VLTGGGGWFIELGFGLAARSTFLSDKFFEGCLLAGSREISCCILKGDCLTVGSLDPTISVGIVGVVVVERGLGLTAVDTESREETKPSPETCPAALRASPSAPC